MYMHGGGKIKKKRKKKHRQKVVHRELGLQLLCRICHRKRGRWWVEWLVKRGGETQIHTKRTVEKREFIHIWGGIKKFCEVLGLDTTEAKKERGNWAGSYLLPLQLNYWNIVRPSLLALSDPISFLFPFYNVSSF